MENFTNNRFEPGDDLSAKKSIQTFFIYHLNRIYAAKLRLTETLDELLNQIVFTDVAVAVRATLSLVRGHIIRMEDIYKVLNIVPSSHEVNELISLIEAGHHAIIPEQDDLDTFDLSILAFLQSVENLELASFKVLQLAAKQLEIPFIAALLEQCIAGAEADYELLLELMAKHLKK